MRKLCIMILFPIAVACFTGCVTISYHDSMKGVSSGVKEFTEFDGTFKLYRGLYSDKTVSRNGREYYETQFDGVLEGTGRYLNVLVPVKYGYDPVVFESSASISGDRPAFLAVERYCCMDDYKEIYDPSYSLGMGKDAEKMKGVLKKYFPGLENSGGGVMFISLSFTNVNYFSLITSLWRPGEEVDKRIENTFLLNAEYSKLDVRWVNRSRVMSALSKGGYVFTAAADIITSPIQLIGVLIYMAAGGGVR